jgi:Ca2+-binding EF-hand superfamily protein
MSSSTVTSKREQELKGKEAQASQQEIDELKQIFDQFDHDKSGKLDRQELEQLMKTVNPNVTSQDIDAMIHHADWDSDGLISFDEFKLQML